MSDTNHVYQYVTERITARLNEGEIPWLNTRSKPLMAARNMVSAKPYSGCNFWLLNFAATAASPFYLTFNQIKANKGSLKKGSKSSMIIFWKRVEKKNEVDEFGNKKTFGMLKYYLVFNVGDCEGIKDPLLDEKPIADPIAAAEAIIANMPGKPEIDYSSNVRACYQPANDKIVMPQASGFTSKEQYYRTFFHELAHSTGHTSRVNRFGDGTDHLGDQSAYGFEELVAELTASYLCAQAGIFEETSEKNAGYCQAWMSSLGQDPKLFVRAATAAQKAADYILNVRKEEEVAE